MPWRILTLLFAAASWRCNFDDLCRDRTEQQLKNADEAIELYRGTRGTYPNSLSDLVTPRDGSAPILKRIPRDGWGRALLYRRPSAGADIGYDLFSAGKDGLAETEDDVAVDDANAFWLHPLNASAQNEAAENEAPQN